MREIAFDLKRLSKVMLLAILAGAFLAVVGRSRVAVAGPAGPEANAAVQERILASTVQIEMVGKARAEAGIEHLPYRRGLGTLVIFGGERYLITHNHWLLKVSEVESVVLLDGAGQHLLELDGTVFFSLVRYQDGGTLVLQAPPSLTAVVPAELADGATLQTGDNVWLATRDGQALGVALARVEDVDAAVVPGQVEMRGEATAVSPGDSGGGVWRDGKLVGNLWAITLEETRWPWSDWLDVLGGRQATGSYTAGLQPLGGAPGVASGDLAPAPKTEADLERGPGR